MLQKTSYIFVDDNTMIFKAKIIHLYGGFFKKTGKVGTYVLTAIPHRRVTRQFITKTIHLAIITTQKKKYQRINGIHIKFNLNKIVFLSDQKKFIGTRIYGPIAQEILQTKLTRLLSVAKKAC